MTDTIKCPRCGYDQRGVVAAWTESCPLQGTCSECGLEFWWADVLLPNKFEPKWCIEFAPRESLGGSFFRTYWRSLAPWQFWRRLQMSYALRLRRLCLYVFMFVLPLVFTYIGIQGEAAVYVRNQTQREIDQNIRNLPGRIASLQASLAQIDEGSIKGQANAANLRNLIAQWQSIQSTTVTIEHSSLAAMFEAVFMPFAESSAGRINYGATATAYPAPARLWWEVERFSPALSHRDLRILGGVGIWILGGFLMALFWPALFVLLPYSRALFKIRWAHLVRITAYSIAIPATFLLLALITAMTFFPIKKIDLFTDPAIRLVLWVGCGLALFIWWAAAIRLYLRIRGGVRMAAVLGLMSYLAALNLIWLTQPAVAMPLIEFFYRLF